VRLAILGGSFNPIHMGHLYLADAVLSSLPFDRVLLVPAHISPFKQGAAPSASAQDRLDMVLASIPASPGIGVEDMEIKRKGISYTVDTLKEILKRYRLRGKPGLIMGDDLLPDFPRWQKAGEIAELAELIVARRLSPRDGSLPGEDDPAGRPGLRDFPFPSTRIENEVMEISSARIRESIARGGPWRSLVPQGARFLIEERGLYREKPEGKKPRGGNFSRSPGPISRSLSARVEDTVRSMIKPGRFLHSRGTALMARDLALVLGLDGDAAYLAGIAHDMGKGLGGGELLALAGEDGEPLSALERKKPELLHGRAAAVLLQRYFDIHNRDILEAVALHTGGRLGMGKLAQVLYVADKLEFTREGVDPLLREGLARVLAGDGGFDALFSAVLEDNVRYLRSRAREVSAETLKILGNLQKER
jgi:nicotinate-nucleotide adenylyltransferase